MNNKKITSWTEGLGCFTIVLLAMATILLIFPTILAFGGFLWGGVIYAVWNLVVVPTFGVPALTYFWQCFICGVALTLLFGTLRGVTHRKKHE